MVNSNYFSDALDCMRELYKLRNELQKTHDNRTASMNFAFATWRGEAQEEAEFSHSQHNENHEDLKTQLNQYLNSLVDHWLEAAYSYNESVRNQVIQELQVRLDRWNEEVWDKTKEEGLIEDIGTTAIEAVDAGLDFINPFGESRIKVNNAEHLVPPPAKHKDRPQPPVYDATRVFVEYGRNSDPTKEVPISYSNQPSIP